MLHSGVEHLNFFLGVTFIGDLPKKYNCLVGHYNCNDAKAFHYTNGGPWFKEYKDKEKSLAWWEVYESL